LTPKQYAHVRDIVVGALRDAFIGPEERARLRAYKAEVPEAEAMRRKKSPRRRAMKKST
jgi:hypothetical protein